MIGLLSGDDDYPMCRRPLALAVGNVKSAQYKNSSYRDILQFKFYELPLAFSLTKMEVVSYRLRKYKPAHEGCYPFLEYMVLHFFTIILFRK